VLRVACCVLRVACCVLRVACCVLRVACCVLCVACVLCVVACCMLLHVACCWQQEVQQLSSTIQVLTFETGLSPLVVCSSNIVVLIKCGLWFVLRATCE
jgi:hypothetical protein